jgi:hypothetical protein
MNWRIWWLGFAVFLAENFYFGWNFVAKSDAEFAADLLVFSLYALAFFGRIK